MKRMTLNAPAAAVLAAMVCCLAVESPVKAQEPETQERVEALKQSLAKSQAALRGYEWIETTVVALKGEEKSREQKRCYYGSDGILTKVALTAPAEAEAPRGLRGRIAENKKEEMTDYMQSAVALVKSYIPPVSEKIQEIAAAGRVSIDILKPGEAVRVNFPNYHVPGDTLSVQFNTVGNYLLGVEVSTYLDTPDDAVHLTTQFGELDDGTTFARNSTLIAAAKGIKVTVENSGYRRLH